MELCGDIIAGVEHRSTDIDTVIIHEGCIDVILTAVVLTCEVTVNQSVMSA